MELKKFMGLSQSFARMPENQFAHAWSLLSAKGREITQKSDYSDLLDPNLFLGFVDNDALLRFYQNDALFLGSFFMMGKKSEPIFEIFRLLFNVWIFEIRLTANKSGAERRLQHFGSQPLSIEGFGKMLEAYNRQKDAATQQGGMYP